MRLFLALLFLVLLPSVKPAQVHTAGPVTVNEQGPRLTLGNDFLDRTIEVSDGSVHTVSLRNKLSGRTHEVRGEEFELKLIYERVGYTFGGENPLVLTSRDLQVKSHRVENEPDGGKRAVYQLVLPHSPQEKTGLEATLIYELKPEDSFTRQWMELKTIGIGTFFIDSLAPSVDEWPGERFRFGGFGQPLFTDDLFMGREYPTSLNLAHHSAVSLGGVVGLDIPQEGYTSEPAVIGVAAQGLVHQAFMGYVRRMRAVPVRPFITYNSWYDLQHTAMTSDLLLERVKHFDDLLVHKYGIHMQSFLLDDAWDDQNTLWEIDPRRFPGGFRDLVSALKGMDSHLGLWYGPIGGYGYRQLRIAAGRRKGMEVTTNGEYLCLAGRNYSRYFRQSLLNMVRDYGVNQFKVDGIPFGCNDPSHGHPVGIYSREADLRSLLGTLEALRGANPKVFLDVTTSTWLSPWWLRWADTIWEGGEDYGYLETVPTLTERQSSMNYRDLVLYNDYVHHQVQFPMSSLWTQSIIKGTYLKLGGEHESLEDWKDHLVNFLGVGSQLNELYITPSLLTPEEWDALGHGLQWAVANAHPLLDNSTFVLGDPAKREPYGYLHFSPEKTLLMLRNPFIRPAAADLKLDEQAGFELTDRTYLAEVIYPFREILPGTYHYGDTLHAYLDGYQHQMIEFRPLAAGEVHAEGIRYSIETGVEGGVGFRVYAPDGSTADLRFAAASDFETARVDGEEVELKTHNGHTTLSLHFGKTTSRASQPSFSAPTIQAGDNGTVRVSLHIQIPQDFRDAQTSLLLEFPERIQTASVASPEMRPPQPAKDIPAEARDYGKPVTLATQKSAQGGWYFFTARLAPGNHALEFSLQLPLAARGSAKLSGWLRAKRALAERDVRITFRPGQRLTAPPGDLLPASPQTERLTYNLFERMAL